jgi:hypothetical protein
MLDDYPKEGYPTPGSFEHIARPCPVHGDQSVFARPYRSTVPHVCVACALEVLDKLVTGEE